jgi:hypothetical protein
MNRALLRRLISTDFENLLDALSTRQHLSPHESVAQSLAGTVERLGVCPKAVDQALRWLQVDPTISVGRLRRTELMQLARSIHRFWRQRTAESAPSPQTK